MLCTMLAIKNSKVNKGPHRKHFMFQQESEMVTRQFQCPVINTKIPVNLGALQS
jgi:hypothetical protein